MLPDCKLLNSGRYFSPHFSIDSKSDKLVSSHSMSSTRKTRQQGKDTKVTFIASPEERRIIAAGQQKYAIRKMSEIIRMALRRYAETEGFMPKSA